MRLLRIVPDNTKFDFMRFRRISFPVVGGPVDPGGLALFLRTGSNFGIDFRGGTLIEMQTKSAPADLAKMRATLGGSASARSRCSSSARPTTC